MKSLIDSSDFRQSKPVAMKIMFLLLSASYVAAVYLSGTYWGDGTVAKTILEAGILKQRVEDLSAVDPKSLQNFAFSVVFAPTYSVLLLICFLTTHRLSKWQVPLDAKTRVRSTIGFILVAAISFYLYFTISLFGSSGELVRSYAILIWPLFLFFDLFVVFCLSFGIYQLFGVFAFIIKAR